MLRALWAGGSSLKPSLGQLKSRIKATRIENETSKMQDTITGIHISVPESGLRYAYAFG